MAESYCPVCYSELEVRDVAPCFDCGDDPRELEELANGTHTYAEVLAFGVPIVLCDFCDADFSSYDPAYFNRASGTTLGLREFVFIRQVADPAPAKTSTAQRATGVSRFFGFSLRCALPARLKPMKGHESAQFQQTPRSRRNTLCHNPVPVPFDSPFSPPSRAERLAHGEPHHHVECPERAVRRHQPAKRESKGSWRATPLAISRATEAGSNEGCSP